MLWKDWPIYTIDREDNDFPIKLKKIRPLINKLYYRGNWQEQTFKNAIAVVGSRRISRYGKELTELFINGLVDNDITIVSGFMYGVDTEAHKNTILCGGKNIAVLGCGLDYIYPKENENLYEQILETNGLIISEYEKDFKPTLWSFPQRNRIVAALANRGVLLIEAGLKSGSLITAKYARKYGIEVFCVPGSVFSPVSEGTNYLIKNGLAKMVTNANDIIKSNLDNKYIQTSLFDNLTDSKQIALIKVLEESETDIDSIAIRLELSVSEVVVILSELELKGLILEESGKYFLVKHYR